MTVFGLPAFIGGRQVGNLRQRLGPRLLIFAGIIGVAVWGALGYDLGLFFVLPVLVGFGFAFVML